MKLTKRQRQLIAACLAFSSRYKKNVQSSMKHVFGDNSEVTETELFEIGLVVEGFKK